MATSKRVQEVIGRIRWFHAQARGIRLDYGTSTAEAQKLLADIDRTIETLQILALFLRIRANTPPQAAQYVDSGFTVDSVDGGPYDVDLKEKMKHDQQRA